ncbi:LysR family transcriptional regulator [Streptomyces sp. NPDC054784]
MQLDLNLLTALDALLEEGSVAGAADRLHVTPPAMSRSLGRIRKATGDPILVRTGRTMVPTAHAQAIRAQVHDVVQQAHHLLSAQREPELATLERVFTVRLHDSLTAARGPELITAVHTRAPGVRLRLTGESGTDGPELRRGEVDLASDTAAPSLPDLRHRLVGEDRLTVTVRAGHPLTESGGEGDGDSGADDLARYAAAEHVTVSRRGLLRDPVDAVLAEHGLARRVVATSPTTDTALRLARGTDLVLTLPEAVTRTTRAQLGLVTVALPVAMPPVPLHLVWHGRYDNDRAHAWLRDRVAEALQPLFTPTDGPA